VIFLLAIVLAQEDLDDLFDDLGIDIEEIGSTEIELNHTQTKENYTVEKNFTTVETKDKPTNEAVNYIRKFSLDFILLF